MNCRSILLLVFGLVLAATPARTQSLPASATPVAGAPVAALVTLGQATAAVEPPAFAERAQQARTMRAYWHVFIAFALVWLLLFGYAISLGLRWARLERQLQMPAPE